MMKFTNVSLLTVVASLVLLAGCTTTDNGQNTKLAECLTSKGVTMYGTNRCSHCQNQKELFGYDAFTKINFVDCDKEKNTCALGFNGYSNEPSQMRIASNILSKPNFFSLHL